MELSYLNKAQQQAVTSTEGSYMIIAGLARDVSQHLCKSAKKQSAWAIRETSPSTTPTIAGPATGLEQKQKYLSEELLRAKDPLDHQRDEPKRQTIQAQCGACPYFYRQKPPH
jgi:hypothetical protein